MKFPVPQERRILLVEDDYSTTQALTEILEFNGYQVAVAHDGWEALQVLRNCRPPFVILLDLRLPIMSGQEFLKNQRQDAEVARIPVIVMSGELAPELPPNVIMLHKPIDLPTLLCLLEAYYTATAGAAKRIVLQRRSSWNP